LKEAGETLSEYGQRFHRRARQKGEVRNQLFDLAHRHLEAAGISRQLDGVIEPSTRARALLDEVKIFRSLSDEERDQLASP
jgi:hypothetical protein